MINPIPYTPNLYESIHKEEIVDDQIKKTSNYQVKWVDFVFKEIHKNMIEDTFDELVNNKTFISEAKEARKKIRQNRSSFTNFTTKFSDLID